jgi:biopolymer transport protein ExbD
VMVVFISAGAADAQPATRTLKFLPNGHVQFDAGPELDLRHPQPEIKRMARERDCPDVHVRPDKHTTYARVAAVMKLFQQFGCYDLGFLDTQNSN